MQVKDVMIPAVGSTTPDASLRQAAETLKALNIDPLPVVSGGRLVGLLFERDLQERARQDGLAASSDTVSDVMTASIACCQAEQTLHDALAEIESRVEGEATRRVPVVDDAGALVGLVDLADLRRHENAPGEEVTAAGAVQSIDQLVEFDQDRVDYMNDESFPASDPLPPPSVLGPDGRSGD